MLPAPSPGYSSKRYRQQLPLCSFWAATSLYFNSFETRYRFQPSKHSLLLFWANYLYSGLYAIRAGAIIRNRNFYFGEGVDGWESNFRSF